MSNEPRKASDVLLDLETKIDQVVALQRSQDLILKILTNKINALIEMVNSAEDAPPPTVSALPNNQIVPIHHEDRLPVQESPSGFRRTSRPETYVPSAPPPSKITQKQLPAPKPQMPAPPPPVPEEQEVVYPVIFPEYNPSAPPQSKKVAEAKQPAPVKQHSQPSTPGNKVPVDQRIVDRNGKAIFLANVTILDPDGNVEQTARTNGVGKWQASLGVGRWTVKITKQESVSKEKIDVSQDIVIDGQSVTQSLPVLICK